MGAQAAHLVSSVCENDHLCLRLDHLRVVDSPCSVPDRGEAACLSLPAIDFRRDPPADFVVITEAAPSRTFTCVAGAHRHRHFGHSDTVVELDRSEQTKRPELTWLSLLVKGYAFNDDQAWRHKGSLRQRRADCRVYSFTKVARRHCSTVLLRSQADVRPHNLTGGSSESKTTTARARQEASREKIKSTPALAWRLCTSRDVQNKQGRVMPLRPPSSSAHRFDSASMDA